MAVNTIEFAPPPASVAAIPHDYVARLSVEQYHEMIQVGILQSGDPIELLEGWLVYKMTKKPPHETANGKLLDALVPLVPKGWILRIQAPITLSDSEPEPDAAVARGTRQDYEDHHPKARDLAFVVEVSDSTFLRDREVKQRIYARAGIPHYWIVNLIEAQVEIYSEPISEEGLAQYARHQVYQDTDLIPVVVDKQIVGTITAFDLLP